MNITLCPNFNHRETNTPVRFFPNYGKVFNETMPAISATNNHVPEREWTEIRMASIAVCVLCNRRREVIVHIPIDRQHGEDIFAVILLHFLDDRIIAVAEPIDVH